MAHGQHTSAVKALQLELKKINDEPVEGFQVRLVKDSNLFEWQVAIFGPPGTLYEGGYFKVIAVYFCGFADSCAVCRQSFLHVTVMLLERKYKKRLL